MGNSLLYLGHSTIVITTSCNSKIVIDPFLQNNPLCPEAFKTLTDISFVGLTHGHSDHTADVLPLFQNNNPRLFATYELASLVAADGVPSESIEFMNKGGRVRLSEEKHLYASLTHAQHSNSYTTKNGETKYAGEACGIILELPDKKKVYHMGDTSLFGDLEMIGKTYAPDIALIPIGDRFTMGPCEAATAAKLLAAKIVIPIHWGTFGLLTGTPEEFVSALDDSSIKATVLQPGEHLSF